MEGVSARPQPDTPRPPASRPAASRPAGGAAFGAATLAATSLVRLALQFAMLPILARLLHPEDYGLVALCLPVVMAISLLAESGLSAALVRAAAHYRLLEATLFWAAMAQGAVLALLVALGAGPAALLLRTPEAAPIIVALAPVILFTGLLVVPWARLQRGGRLSSLAVAEAAGLVAGALAALGGALAGWGAFALVAQQIGFLLGKGVVLVAMTWPMPRLRLAPALLPPVAPYALAFGASTALAFLANTTDSLLVGALLGAQALGFYTLALTLMRIPETILGGPAWMTLFPAVVEAGADRERLGRAYLLSLRLLLTVAAPMVAGLALTADLVVGVLLGPRWAPAAAVLAMLAPVGLLRCLNPIGTAMLGGTGRAGRQCAAAALAIACSAAGIALGARLGGLPGAAIGQGIALLAANLPLHALALNAAGLRARALLPVLGAPALATVAMAATVIGLRPLVADALPMAGELALLVVAGALVYGAALLALGERTLLREVLRLWRARRVAAA